ncbi:MAG: N-acetylmuramoyl-L-alanine amidase, partial [Pseudomonadota bacterium]
MEADGTLAIAIYCRDALRAAGVNVVMTRETDRDLAPAGTYSQAQDLTNRAAVANSARADCFVSIHTNAAASASAHGTETFHYPGSATGERLARAVQSAVVAALGTYDRGVKSANFAVLRQTTMPAALVEVAFHTNLGEEALLKKPDFQRRAGEAVARGILDFFRVDRERKEAVPGDHAAPGPDPGGVLSGDGAAVVSGTPVAGEAQTTVAQAQAWAGGRGAHQRFLQVIPLYFEIFPRYGLRPEVGVAQAAKETAFGHFPGAVRPEMHNWCGLKTARAAGDKTSDHATFTDDRTGVEAHAQHLAQYAGLKLPPGVAVVDPRFHLVPAGIAQTVEALGGRWAPNPDYGNSIVRDYLTPLLAAAVNGKNAKSRAAGPAGVLAELAEGLQ